MGHVTFVSVNSCFSDFYILVFNFWIFLAFILNGYPSNSTTFHLFLFISSSPPLMLSPSKKWKSDPYKQKSSVLQLSVDFKTEMNISLRLFRKTFYDGICEDIFSWLLGAFYAGTQVRRRVEKNVRLLVNNTSACSLTSPPPDRISCHPLLLCSKTIILCRSLHKFDSIEPKAVRNVIKRDVWSLLAQEA